MNRFIPILSCFLMGSMASAQGWIPVEMSEVDARARVVIVKKYIELSQAAGTQVSYRNLSSSIGKYGLGRGDFHFSGEIWISNQRKFQCITEFVRAGIGPESGEFKINYSDLDENSRCREVPAID